MPPFIFDDCAAVADDHHASTLIFAIIFRRRCRYAPADIDARYNIRPPDARRSFDYALRFLIDMRDMLFTCLISTITREDDAVTTLLPGAHASPPPSRCAFAAPSSDYPRRRRRPSAAIMLNRHAACRQRLPHTACIYRRFSVRENREQRHKRQNVVRQCRSLILVLLLPATIIFRHYAADYFSYFFTPAVKIRHAIVTSHRQLVTPSRHFNRLVFA